MDDRPWLKSPEGCKQWLVCQVLGREREPGKRRSDRELSCKPKTVCQITVSRISEYPCSTPFPPLLSVTLTLAPSEPNVRSARSAPSPRPPTLPTPSAHLPQPHPYAPSSSSAPSLRTPSTPSVNTLRNLRNLHTLRTRVCLYQVPDYPCCSRRCSSCKCSSTCSWHASPRQCRGQHLPQVGAVRWEPAPTMNLHRGATTTASTLHPIVRHHTVRAPPGQPRHRRRPRRRR